MAELFFFTPRHELDAQANRESFIQDCRHKLTVFGEDLNWDANYWPSAGTVFGRFGTRSSRGKVPDDVMQQPFLDFAKAYLRYNQGHKPSKSKLELAALKAIELALYQKTGASDPKFLNVGVLNHAQELARQNQSPGASYNTARQIEVFAEFVSRKSLVTGVMDWKCRLKQPSTRVRTGKKAQERREKKMPDNALLNAIGDIFSKNPSDPRDIFTTSTVAILMSAPSRIHEVLALSVGCEVDETKRDGSVAYGWRFFPGKGGITEIKWIPATMEAVAREAIRRLTDMGEEARKVAKWYEDTDDLFYRHANCPDVAEDEPLTYKQACIALGLAVGRDSLPQVGLSSRAGANTLRSLRQWVNSRLPKGFPWLDKQRGIKYSDALYCSLKHQFRDDNNTSPVQLANPVSRQMLNHDLVADSGNSYCIFSRHNVVGEDGRSIKMTSHQMRHLLNTMCQKGGVAQYDIARWSGRINVKQNRDYDHMSEYELIELIKSGDPSLQLFGPLGEISQKLPMTQQEFNSLVIPTAHVTEYGFCIHDFTMEPCQKYLDCVNCTEQVCIKGCDHKLQRLKERHDVVKRLKAEAEAEIAMGTFGADRHYELQDLTDKRLSQLISILEDPTISQGAMVRLRNDKEFSPFRLAEEQRAQTDKGSMDAPMLSDLRNLLGGGLG